MDAKRICVDKVQLTSDDDDKDQKAVINSLDYDSLAKIFMLLPVPERIDMEEVCVKWKEACQRAWYDIKKYKCESSIGRCYDNRLLTQSYVEKILLMCGKYLNELSLSGVCNSNIMPFVGDRCKNLTSLECEFNDDPSIHDADHFAQAFTQLDKLKSITITLSNNYYNGTLNLSKMINNLPEEIYEIHVLSKPSIGQGRTVSMTIEKFKNLQKLAVHGICSENLLHEISEKTTLVHVDIYIYDVHQRFFSFDRLVNLEHIDLKLRMHTESLRDPRTDPPTTVLFTIFSTCINLKHLHISYGLSYDEAQIPLTKWRNLQNLQYLGITCSITPDLANTMVKYCKNLKHLKIWDLGMMDDTALKKLTELESLECLSLLGCVELKKESIIAISENCKKLKRLEIPSGSIDESRFSSSVLDEIFDEISKLQYLEHLNFSMVKNLKNNSFISKLKGLKELHCGHCKKLTEAGIIQFIKNNPDLEEISVDGIDNITINLVIAVDQVTKNRTNGLQITVC
ncbi:uncharacterized protein LOC122853565 [Aphidius gifuensis]|uniref:uncharacterized protein LOC122853565 n=1 Tax=Aphidius gifuensis TaxID=684658 RepID=UPI001CDCB22C|nr:uncharacterized protein LOC122853565 [Aphidius gifuensis]